jgi:hypothetical protein
MILHLVDKNLPPACPSSFYLISERYYENHYRSFVELETALSLPWINKKGRDGGISFSLPYG